MDIIKLLSKIKEYVQGFLEVSRIQTPRYHFVIEKLDIVYQDTSIRTVINYTPVGCYRPFKNFVFELNDEIVCRKFKPDHARIIIGIDTLEKTLNFNNKEQAQSYLDYVACCISRLKDI